MQTVVNHFKRHFNEKDQNCHACLHTFHWATNTPLCAGRPSIRKKKKKKKVLLPFFFIYFILYIYISLSVPRLVTAECRIMKQCRPNRRNATSYNSSVPHYITVSANTTRNTTLYNISMPYYVTVPSKAQRLTPHYLRVCVCACVRACVRAGVRVCVCVCA